MFHLQVIRSNRGSQWVLLSILYFYEFFLVFFLYFRISICTIWLLLGAPARLRSSCALLEHLDLCFDLFWGISLFEAAFYYNCGRLHMTMSITLKHKNNLHFLYIYITVSSGDKCKYQIKN